VIYELFPNYVPPSPFASKSGGHDPQAPMGAPPLLVSNTGDRRKRDVRSNVRLKHVIGHSLVQVIVEDSDIFLRHSTTVLA